MFFVKSKNSSTIICLVLIVLFVFPKNSFANKNEERPEKKWVEISLVAAGVFALWCWDYLKNDRGFDHKFSSSESSSTAICYLLSADSLEIFNSLFDEEDRAMFIDSFWDEHNTSYDKSGNELRQEFERRVEYANKYYTDRWVQGWRSDRGRVYILHGPPDEIKRMIVTKDSHLDNPDEEMWLYNVRGQRTNIPHQLTKICAHKKFFLFTIISSDASIRQIYSSEFGEYYDDSHFRDPIFRGDRNSTETDRFIR